jgi:integrase
LHAILEMRRLDPDGKEHKAEAYVFGNAIGQRVTTFDRAWQTAVLRSHGHKPTYTKSRILTPESREVLHAVDLHFHDLRREAGSRWLDGGVPLQTVRDWLGHSNVAQTSTYLSSTFAGQHEAMARFDAARGVTPTTVATDAAPSKTGEENPVQRSATDSETGVQMGPQNAEPSDARPLESTERTH